jgi:hypothetical protein
LIDNVPLSSPSILAQPALPLLLAAAGNRGLPNNKMRNAAAEPVVTGSFSIVC